MKENYKLDISHISPEVEQLIKMYATVNGCTHIEMLERIVLEWHAQQSRSERPPGNEDE
ncbi:hypothetical protein ACN23B_11910 [Anabaena sp. FACHB-709]|uniref:Arc-like DNA binding domain-containing protein n=2 Tax=Nostocaceae TaxID=1162 RepID=A0A1Z4KG94_ANAVA|nr:MULTISPECIES: hypothetical protein [Nostocaceae]BAY67992.1 hypothetical protein NIES23_07750 [Trichormus variabilis NIES-23]MBD2169919.1 hypothetical protein [Anabaena cylindrica FACHB-318]MBD2261663.1 hypothetical protein [Anabaena sp. FACHB-709]MBD2271247.1 hypothetical protein [Nostoc sp. PCC 7120 = FACHB-418]MBD2282483.1 hypothetical protein [Anabaena cylindrica FACHB-170]